MEFTGVNHLMDPEPLALEMGYERLPDGSLHVAARTDMPGCTGEMFDWWFRWFNTAQQYIWWHPGDHVHASWDEHWHKGGPYTGSTCTVDERLSGEEVHRLLIHFVEPDEFLGDAYMPALAEGRVSAVVAAFVGLGADAPVVDGRPRGGRLIHVSRDTPTGSTLRSHFFLGTDLPEQMAPDDVQQVVPDSLGAGLLKHAYTEFTFLSRFLPSLFIAENRESRLVPLPW